MSRHHKANKLHGCPCRQRGAALMVMLVIMIIGSAAFLVSSLSSSALNNARQEKTVAALAQAKEALIGRAVLDANRPGSLPCPDTNNDGVADSCSSTIFIGRLPWKTLGLDDLRDGNGERLWYALSPSLRDTGSAINSDTPGQLSISGTGAMSNVAAIVFATGAPLNNQVRDTAANQNNVANYLEGDNANGDTAFVANLPSDTFNDNMLGITTDMLFPTVEKLIVKELSDCLQDYATANHGRYPWAAPLNSAQPPSYDDNSDTLFGRFPDFLGETKNDSNDTMSDHWPGTSACNNIFTTSGWWTNTNWRELAFYSLSDLYKPDDTTAPASCSTCLVVNPPSSNADKKALVLLSGKKLSGKNRINNADKATISNYLEGGNADGLTPFEQNTRTNTFNDSLLFQ